MSAAAGAKLINGKPLRRIEVHGKQLFYFFGEGADTTVLHIHFGAYVLEPMTYYKKFIRSKAPQVYTECPGGYWRWQPRDHA